MNAATESTIESILLTVGEVAELLICSPRHVTRLASQGAMPAAVRIGHLVRWRRAEIEQWIADGCPRAR